MNANNDYSNQRREEEGEEEDYIPEHCNLGYALVFPLKATLVPFQSASLLEKCRSQDSIQRLQNSLAVPPKKENASAEMDAEKDSRRISTNKEVGGVSPTTISSSSSASMAPAKWRKSIQDSYLRRRSISLPEDIDRMATNSSSDVLYEEDVFTGRANCAVNGKNEASSRVAIVLGSSSGSTGGETRKPSISGVNSLPRINRSKITADSRGFLATNFGMRSSPVGSCSLTAAHSLKDFKGSFGDLMNIAGYGNRTQVYLTLARSVPLETVAGTNSPTPSCPISAITASLPCHDSVTSIPEMNISRMTSDTEDDRQSSTCSGSDYSPQYVPHTPTLTADFSREMTPGSERSSGVAVYSVKSDGRAFSNENELGVVMNTSETFSTHKSDTMSDYSPPSHSASFRIDSCDSSVSVKIASSSSCCGVNLGRPMCPRRNSPPYITSEFSTSCPTLAHKKEKHSHHHHHHRKNQRRQQNQRRRSESPEGKVVAQHISRQMHERERSPKGGTNRAYRARKNGVPDNLMIIAQQQPTAYMALSSLSYENTPAATSTNASGTPDDYEIRRRRHSTERDSIDDEIRSEWSRNNSVDSSYVPTVERAKRLSRLIRDRQEAQRVVSFVQVRIKSPVLK